MSFRPYWLWALCAGWGLSPLVVAKAGAPPCHPGLSHLILSCLLTLLCAKPLLAPGVQGGSIQVLRNFLGGHRTEKRGGKVVVLAGLALDRGLGPCQGFSLEPFRRVGS